MRIFLFAFAVACIAFGSWGLGVRQGRAERVAIPPDPRTAVTTRAPAYPCEVEGEWVHVPSLNACTEAQDEALKRRALADPWGPNPYIFEAPRDRYADKPILSMETWLFCKTLLPATDRFPAYGWPMREEP